MAEAEGHSTLRTTKVALAPPRTHSVLQQRESLSTAAQAAGWKDRQGPFESPAPHEAEPYGRGESLTHVEEQGLL